jgi:hypothetical protein
MITIEHNYGVINNIDNTIVISNGNLLLLLGDKHTIQMFIDVIIDAISLRDSFTHVRYLNMKSFSDKPIILITFTCDITDDDMIALKLCL